VRYAVVGLGHIAQAAVLPAFKQARGSNLVALVSSDEEKLRKLGRKYRARTYTYDQYDECLAAEDIDAVYIAVPNHLHADYAIRAARAGVHVLCEKPLATSEDDCLRMIHAADDAGVRLMTAYRLHFEPADLKAIELVQSGKLGEPKLFNSVFGYQVKEGNIRTESEEGGSPLWDLGVYCTNAARYLFRDEPIEILGVATQGQDERFSEIAETFCATLRFPNDRVATFSCSFGIGAVQRYQLIGTKGDLIVDPAYDYAEGQHHRITIKGKSRERSFRKHDQFGAEIEYFSKCVREDSTPEPSGWEGLADVRIVVALQESAKEGRVVSLGTFERRDRPDSSQEITKPPVQEPELVNVEAPVAE